MNMEQNTAVEPGLEPLLAQANLARIRGQRQEAVDYCVQVLRTQPGNADAHSLLGDIYRDQGAFDDAIQWYRMAADLRPNGPDAEKLRKLEADRERRAAQSGVLNPAMAPASYEAGAGGTTQLMGQSPRRWLNTLTIVSACFLAATILVLAMLRNPSGRADSRPRYYDNSSHPSMPTAESGMKLPPINPRGATVLPVGEQPKPQQKIHQAGEGLAPDRSGASVTPTLPTFSKSAQASPAQSAPVQRPGPALAPAPVRDVRPLDTTMTVAGAGATAPADQRTADSQQRTIGSAGIPEDRDVARERDPNRADGNAKPAPETGAGDQRSDGGSPPPQQ
jgi:hypothetical protein